MVEPIAGLFGAAAVVVRSACISLFIIIYYNISMGTLSLKEHVSRKGNFSVDYKYEF